MQDSQICLLLYSFWRETLLEDILKQTKEKKSKKKEIMEIVGQSDKCIKEENQR